MAEYLHPGVYVSEIPSGVNPIEGVSTSTACFVGKSLQGRPFAPQMVTSWTEFGRIFGGLNKKCDMPLSVYHFFQNGGKRAYIIRTIDPVGSTTATAGDNKKQPKLEALGPGLWGNVNVVISKNAAFPDRIDIRVDVPPIEGVERFQALSLQEDQEKFYAAILNRDSNYIKVALNEDKEYMEFDSVSALITKGDSVTMELRGGSDGDPKLAIGTQSLSAAVATLDPIEDVSILAFPRGQPAHADEHRLQLRHEADHDGVPHRSAGRRAEHQPRRLDRRGQEIQREYAPKDSFSVMYFPWVEIADPYSQIPGATRFAPPSGFMAGLYARIDNSRGVWKAPAGTEASLLGAVGLAVNVTDAQQDTLNPIGVNCIRPICRIGHRVLGSAHDGDAVQPRVPLCPDPTLRHLPPPVAVQGHAVDRV